MSPVKAGSEVVDRIVAIINDSVITMSELNAAAAMAADKQNEEDKKDAKKMGELKSKVLDGLIEQKLVKQASDKAGIDVSEREIDSAVDEVKKQNNMSHEALLLALAQNGLTLKEYREQLKEQIRQYKFINKEFRSKISIQNEEIEDYYKQNIEEFYAMPSFKARMILLSSSDKKTLEPRLKAVEDGIAKGEDFSALARQYSDGAYASSGGDLGYLKSGEIDKTLEAELLKLKPGGLTAPLERPEGIYILQLVDVRRGEPKPLDEVRGFIHDKLFNKIMEDRFSFWLKEVKKTAHIEIRL